MIMKKINNFFDLAIPTDKMEYLHSELKIFSKKQLSRAVNSVCSEVEKIHKGSNLYAIIRKRITGSPLDMPPIGWLCSKCNNINPLDAPLCDCQRQGYLSIQQKQASIHTFKRLGCKNIAQMLEIKLKKQVNQEKSDPVPF